MLVEATKDESSQFKRLSLRPNGILTNHYIDTITDTKNCINLREIYQISETKAIAREANIANLINIHDIKDRERLRFASFTVGVAINHSDVLNEELNINKFTLDEMHNDWMPDRFPDEITENKKKFNLLYYIHSLLNTLLWIFFCFVVLLIIFSVSIIFIRYKFINKLVSLLSFCCQKPVLM